MGNIMIIPSPPLSKWYLNLLSYHVYPAPLPLGRDIIPTLMSKHIFPSFGLLIRWTHFPFHWFAQPFLWSIYVISRNNSLLMETPRFTTLSVWPCYYCWRHPGNPRWTRTLPIGPPRSTSRKMVLFVPRPWYQRCCQHNWQSIIWHALLSAPFLLLTHMVGP